MLCSAAVDAQGLAIEVQLAGVAGGTGDIEKLVVAAGILVPGEADGQVARVLGCGLLSRVHEETETRQVGRFGKTLLGKRQLQCSEPVIAQALDLGALGREVVDLSVGGGPLVLVVHLLHRHVIRQLGVDHVIKDHGQGQSHK